MKNVLIKSTLLSALAVLLALTAAAQNGATSDPRSIPFADGEVLTYEGKISKIIKGIAVADLTFTLAHPDPAGPYQVKADATSKGTLTKLFRFSFLYQMESTIAGNGFRVEKTTKHDVQKDRVRDSEAVFDYKDRQVTYVETDPKAPMRPPRKIASEIGLDSHDLLSGLYSLRLMPLAIGKSFDIEVSDAGLVYRIPVKVTARERQKSAIGNLWCFRIEPDVFGPDRLIEKEGSMFIWITDDARRIPVRSQVNAPIGRVEIKLKSVKNLRS